VSQGSGLRQAVVVLVCCASGLTIGNAIAAYRRWFPPPAEPDVRVQEWRSYGEAGNRIGSRNAPVTIVEFVDYLCTPCKELAPALEAILKQHPGAVALVVRNAPFHGERSALVARASYCAGRQGRFEQFYDRALAMAQPGEARPGPRDYANESGVPDTAAFRACTESQLAFAAVDSDRVAARRLGVVATPTLLVNDDEYIGEPAQLERIVTRHVRFAAHK
jgi:protein-disulfide isomerase